jgi:hypothetical protein
MNTISIVEKRRNPRDGLVENRKQAVSRLQELLGVFEGSLFISLLAESGLHSSDSLAHFIGLRINGIEL